MPSRSQSSAVNYKAKVSIRTSPSRQEEEQNQTDESSGSDFEQVDEEDADADAPRVAQWVDEDELDVPEPSQIPSTSYSSLKSDLSSLPMGTLRRAQKAIDVQDQSEESDSSNSQSGSEHTSEDEDGRPSKPEWSTQPRSDIAKRKNKHAPMEVTSKKPVTRRRTVVDVHLPQARDPRFLTMTGEFSAQKFNDNYRFLSDSHETELSTLRENLKRARKLLATSPRNTRHEREAEVGRLELAMKRAESAVNKDRQDAVQQEALRKVGQQEREQQRTGKGKWFMKESEKKEMLVKAKYDALAEHGGQKAVKKAIEKRRKKISQKEKKSRPLATESNAKSNSYARGSFPESRSSKRSIESTKDYGGGKRRRLQ